MLFGWEPGISRKYRAYNSAASVLESRAALLLPAKFYYTTNHFVSVNNMFASTLVAIRHRIRLMSTKQKRRAPWLLAKMPAGAVILGIVPYLANAVNAAPHCSAIRANAHLAKARRSLSRFSFRFFRQSRNTKGPEYYQKTLSGCLM
jgi:hypothetical protein